MAEIDAGVLMTDSDRRVAVTTTSLRVESLVDDGGAVSCVHAACTPNPSDAADIHPATANRRVECVLESIGNSSQFFTIFFLSAMQYDEYDFIYHEEREESHRKKLVYRIGAKLLRR
jgi:hypothetical protein